MVENAPTIPVKEPQTAEMVLSPTFNGFPKSVWLLKDPKFSDIKVLAGTKAPVEFKLHRAILAERSTFFNKILQSDFIESKTQEVLLPEVKPSVFALVVKYLYTGEYVSQQNEKSSPDDIASMYEAADYLDIPDLKQVIMEMIWKKVENFAEELDVKLVTAVLEMLAKTFYETAKLEKLIQKLLERKKLGSWMERPKFKEVLDNYGVLGRLIIENSRMPGITPVPKGWAKDIKPKVFCRACSVMKDLGSNHPAHTFTLACGHQATV
ncbi:hypothetical protein H072_3840 [Dactylellina haptotyla CBS 200.50]|uniref:BTB domain-containing protein n=1 Tax=Dactylellina haptotyla (strain CBS 200.50) TaxID=1284197 RepID=S8BRF5_DACHA|nr:hypothetical protein H072_3840 [Dactylellina haptotyla CBS 200.50]